MLECKFFKTENAEIYYSHLESLLPQEIVTSDFGYTGCLIIIDNFFFSNYSEKIIDRIKKKTTHESVDRFWSRNGSVRG